MGLISRVSSRTYRSSMRTQLCQFSATKIYPGHGKDFIRYDGKRIVLINGKSERLFRKEEPTKSHLDRSLQAKAQKRYHDRARRKEEEQEGRQSQQGYWWSILGRNSG